MTAPGRSRTSVRCVRLRDFVMTNLYRSDECPASDRLAGIAINELELFVVVDHSLGATSVELRAAEADVDRWRRATAGIVRIAKQAIKELAGLRVRLRPPNTAGRWLVWKVSGGGTERDRRKVRAAMERIESELRTACRAYRDDAADLTERIEAQDRGRQWLVAQYNKKEARREEWRRAARERAIAEIAEAPVWSYQVGPREPSTETGRNRLVIALQSLEQPADPTLGDPVTGRTPAQINDVIERLRVDDPYLIVEAAAATREHLSELAWSQELSGQWREVSGVRLDTHPLTPEERRGKASRPSSSGPTSGYYSGGPHF